MSDKIVIITGANSGIGKAATIKFATEGYTVVMACRNLEKSKTVQEEITHQTNNKNIDLIKLDISSFQSIQEFCIEFKHKYQKLDILINNAASFNYGEKKYQLSKDNIELTFATNTFGPFLLTMLLQDELEKSDDPRILNSCTTNIRHFFEPRRKIDFDNLQGEFKDSRKYNAYKLYGDSKMALLLLTFKLAEIFKNERLKVNAIQISAVKISKESIKKLKSIWKYLARIQNSFSNTPESMAETYFNICTSDEFNKITGKFFNDKSEILQSSNYSNGIIDSIKQIFDRTVYPKYADSKEVMEVIWELSKKLTKLENTN
jgi:NAD(P)-dependent dehydrogenase (short-subunit alcohol dehydrogenase family)